MTHGLILAEMLCLLLNRGLFLTDAEFDLWVKVWLKTADCTSPKRDPEIWWSFLSMYSTKTSNWKVNWQNRKGHMCEILQEQAGTCSLQLYLVTIKRTEICCFNDDSIEDQSLWWPSGADQSFRWQTRRTRGRNHIITLLSATVRDFSAAGSAASGYVKTELNVDVNAGYNR